MVCNEFAQIEIGKYINIDHHNGIRRKKGFGLFNAATSFQHYIGFIADGYFAAPAVVLSAMASTI